jgi:MFS family permease
MDGLDIAASTVSRGGLLDRSRTVARPGFNRWLVPPAALAIHLCIGMAYGFSVFWLPLTKVLGITAPIACAANSTLLQRLVTTTCDWRVADLTIMYTLFFVFLGSSAAIWGGWLERAGPRKAGVVSALCWCGGLVISAVGIQLHQLWMLWLGSGVIGGVGLGLGYISPVSTLIKWFPDRRGMATGMAIMGFGGGALIGAPLSDLLMTQFRTPASVGVWQCFLVLAAGYGVFMLSGAFGYRVPPDGWQPEGWMPKTASSRLITSRNVHLKDAHRTPQFWMIWAVLCLNVSAGIGVLGLASPMLQEMFGGSLIGQPGIKLAALDKPSQGTVATVGAAFVGLLSLFNIGGRFFWASFSDRIGRKLTYATFFALGIALYGLSPLAGHLGSQGLFVAMMCVILSMYGGGFATVPAYLADMFGTRFVGAIHGRLLTAWSTAGVIGPILITQVREAQVAAGVPPDLVYDRTLYMLAGLLAAGFVANLLIRPVADRWYMSDGEGQLATATKAGSSFGIGRGGVSATALLAWACVVLPLLWGVYVTLSKSVVLFR